MSDLQRAGMSRREFGKTSAVAGLAVLGLGKRKWKPNSDTLTVGLLGCGGRGTRAAINMLESENNVQLVAMADLFQDKLDASQEKIKKVLREKEGNVVAKFAPDKEKRFVGWDAYKQILATDIDIIIEGTLPYSRPKHVEAAVAAKKHIFTEKPVAVDPVGVRRILAAARRAKELGLSLVAGTQRRHQGSYIQTIGKIHDGAIGDVVAMRAYWCGALPFVRDRQPEWSDLEFRIRNWINYCWTCGDNIVEQHVHNLDVCNWVLNDHPDSVVASGGRSWKPREERYGDLYDHFSCDYHYASGAQVFSFSRHWNGAYSSVFEDALGAKGRSSCRDMPDDDETRYHENPYVQEHIDLVNSIRGDGPYLNEGEQVAHSTLTAIMGRMSAYTGRRVSWDEAMASDLSLVPKEWDFNKPYPLGPIPVPVSA